MEISYLIGSGFSRAKGLPTVDKINSLFTSIKADDISISPDRTALHLSNNNDPNGWMSIQQRRFFEEFVAFYCKDIIHGNPFQYEEFYDFYFSFYRTRNNEAISNFCNEFRKKYNITNETFNDDANLIMKFNDVFTQILANELQRSEFYENNVHRINYSPYDDIIKYLYKESEENIIHVHSLNHDLLFEHMCTSTDLWDKFSDGFREMGSPYFGQVNIEDRIHKKYLIRLRRFTNNYNKPIRLYKLHGSVDTYAFQLGYPNQDNSRVKVDYGVEDFIKEVKDEHGEFSYQRGFRSTYPDFLSGTTEKIKHYNEDFYKDLFSHFDNNLRNSQKLIIIGYGFGDTEINNYIKLKFLNKGLVPTVINPSVPSSPFYQSNTFNLIPKSVADVTYSEYEAL